MYGPDAHASVKSVNVWSRCSREPQNILSRTDASVKAYGPDAHASVKSAHASVKSVNVWSRSSRERQKREKCLVQMLTKYLLSDASVKAALLVVCTKSSKASSVLVASLCIIPMPLQRHWNNASGRQQLGRIVIKRGENENENTYLLMFALTWFCFLNIYTETFIRCIWCIPKITSPHRPLA